MREMTSDELKKVGLEVLKYIDEICRSNSIQYYIMFGSLIGAVRHKGYIPWDDDIDIGMTRENYIRFIQVMQSQSKYKIISMETDPDYYFTFARVSDQNTQLNLRGMREIHDWGVFVDVFPMDNAPAEAERDQYFATFRMLRKKVGYTIPSSARYRDSSLKTIIRRIRRFPKRILWGTRNFDKYRQQLTQHITQFNNQSSDFFVIAETPYHEKAVFRKKIFDNCVELEFEQLRVLAPAGYDEFLKQVYGDYMKLPPEEKRKSQHHFDAYWKDEGA